MSLQSCLQVSSLTYVNLASQLTFQYRNPKHTRYPPQSASWRIYQLSYNHHLTSSSLHRANQFTSSKARCAPEGTRTPNRSLRTRLLYPIELQAHKSALVDDLRTYYTNLEAT